MLDQPELNLPRPLDTRVSRRSTRPEGLGPGPITLAAAAVVLLIWAMWVTRMLLAPPPNRIVSVRLSSIVGEYVQAEARSAAPPAQVEAEMRSFMASLDRELQRRSARGQVVLVGEAVLSRNVLDITDSLRHAVYSSGVARPRLAPPSTPGVQTAPGLMALGPAPGSGGAVGATPFVPPPAGLPPAPPRENGDVAPQR